MREVAANSRAAATGSDWTPADFILRGQYCPRPAIYAALEGACRAVGASAGLVFAADEGAVLRSLCFQAPKEPGTSTDLVGLLRSTSALNSQIDFRSLLLHGPLHVRSGPGSRAWQLLEEMQRLATRNRMPELAAWLEPDGRWWSARVPDSISDARISATVLFRDPAESAVRGDAVDADDHVVEITQRINATAQADVRRDTAIMARLDDRLDPADFVTRTVDFSQAAKSLVTLALEISASDMGACYVFDHGTKTMRRVIGDLPEDLRDSWEYQENLTLESKSVVLTCFSARRPVQLPPGLSARDGAVMTCRQVGEASGGPEGPTIELATPIVGPLASPKARAIGVLTVAKLGSDAGPYGAYDLALLRNVALRLSLISATTNSESAARTFTQLSAHRTARSGGGSLASGLLRTDNIPPLPELDAVDGPLPDDLMATIPAITEGLATLGRVTGSHSATFRAALPSDRTTRVHGVVLRRIAAYPPREMTREGEIQTAEGGGINWRVALEGRPHYAPVVASAKGYLRRRKETVAELSVPVFVEGRVIGVVNLESADRNAYDAQVATAQAFAAHVGLAVADARIAIASILHDYATEIVRRGHDLGSECKSLRAMALGLPSELAEKANKIADDIERKAKGLRRFKDPVPAHTGAGLTFPDLVNAQVGAVGLRRVNRVHNPNDVWWPHSPDALQMVGHALRDILLNVKRHSATDHTRPTLELRQGKWGGRRQDLLIIRNKASEPLDPDRAANVFRAPLVHHLGDAMPSRGKHGTQVPQLGAYLAGTLVRRIGGDVHLRHGRDNETRVVVSVPVSEPSRSSTRETPGDGNR